MAENTLSKNKQGYGYKYTDLAQIHNYLEENNLRYTQYIQKIDGEDYVFTQKYIKGDKEEYVKDGEPLQGCRVVNAVLSGKSNPAQEQGSALTYARRYSLLMAYGLATEDDDAESLTQSKDTTKSKTNADNMNDKVTAEQSRIIYSVMMKKGIDVVASLQKKYGISNTKDLTKKQYATTLQALNKLPDKEVSNGQEQKQN